MLCASKAHFKETIGQLSERKETCFLLSASLMLSFSSSGIPSLISVRLICLFFSFLKYCSRCLFLSSVGSFSLPFPPHSLSQALELHGISDLLEGLKNTG